MVCRLLTPLGVRYEDAWARTYPFDRPVDEIASAPGTKTTIDDVAALLYRAEEQGRKCNVFANNRAYGNATALAQGITRPADLLAEPLPGHATMSSPSSFVPHRKAFRALLLSQFTCPGVVKIFR